jgi:hypothetical protein
MTVRAAIPAHGPVVFPAPPGGWTREAYREAIQAFIQARGRAPHSITMHPHTLAAVTRLVVRREAEQVLDGMLEVVHREEEVLEQAREHLLEDGPHPPQDGIAIVTSDEHDQSTIVMT